MFRRPPHPFWRFFAPVLASLCFASTVISPLLDAGDEGRGPVFESKHDAATCFEHDHTICTQVTANLGVTTEPTRHDLAAVHRFEADATLGNRLAPRGAYFLPVGSRAPPRA